MLRRSRPGSTVSTHSVIRCPGAVAAARGVAKTQEVSAVLKRTYYLAGFLVALFAAAPTAAHASHIQAHADFVGSHHFTAITTDNRVTFTGTNQAAIAHYTQWASESNVGTPDTQITVEPASVCGGPVAGCTLEFSNGTVGVYASSRDSFYFELGHAFDWTMLTSQDRLLLAGKWQDAGWHWWDDDGPMAAGAEQGYGIEDGLEGLFAGYYQSCAWGQDTRNTDMGSIDYTGAPDIPQANSDNFDTCAYVDWRAAVTNQVTS